MLGRFKADIFFLLFLVSIHIYQRSVRRIKHFRLGIDTCWREGLNPNLRRDCEQRAGSWNKRTEKYGGRSCKWSSENSKVFITCFTYGFRLLTRYVLTADLFIPPELAKSRRKVLLRMTVDHSLCKWRLYSDMVYKVLHFRHSLFFNSGIT